MAVSAVVMAGMVLMRPVFMPLVVMNMAVMAVAFVYLLTVAVSVTGVL